MSLSTCKHCGYRRDSCQCPGKRNTSGHHVMYSNYNDLRGASDYATTSRISRTSNSEIKLMEELLPVDGELLSTYISRTAIAESKLVEHSIYQHLFGTKQTWACHTSSRYCFICTLAQYVNTHRSILLSLSDLYDSSKIIINITSDTPPQITLTIL